MPLSPGRISPRNMDDRQWATFVAQAGIQADNRVKTFTPSWNGFSAAPAMTLSYLDYGKIVQIWLDTQVTGTSNADSMVIVTLPDEIIPSGRRVLQCIVVDNGLELGGYISISSGGTVLFAVEDTGGAVPNRVLADYNGFTATGDKGLPSGFFVQYAK